MDSLIIAAARALAAGDSLGALKRVALRHDAPALALRGIAMARLGEFARAKVLLQNAARLFGPREAVARARCVVAEAEIALVCRDLGFPGKALDAARATLEKYGDLRNAAHARHVEARRLLLIGRIDVAERLLSPIDPAGFPPMARAAHDMVLAGIAIRRLDIGIARAALGRAKTASRQANVPALSAEVEAALSYLEAPAARLVTHAGERLLGLDDVEALLASPALVIDACRLAIRDRGTVLGLASRPVLFALARSLAEAWPGEASRGLLVARAFGAKEADESHRARLRVEIGRLRATLGTMAEVVATRGGFTLKSTLARDIVVMAPLVEDGNAGVLALLADGEAWSSSGLALALGASQRSVQRSLEALAAERKAEPLGHGRARRWTIPPMPGFPPSLLLLPHHDLV